MTEIDYAARVQRGITLLDQKWPAWATEINLDRLDIEWGDRCMTAQYGQLHGNADAESLNAWREGSSMLGLDTGTSYEEHGFNAADGSGPRSTYEALNGLWKAAITARRAQAQDAPAEPEATA